MAIKPIIFSTEMVRAILDGRKSVTRRVMKPQPWCAVPRDCATCNEWNKKGKLTEACPASCITMPNSKYDVGDILWVRETYREFCGILYGWQGGAYIPIDDYAGYNYKADDMHVFASGISPICAAFEDRKDDITYDKWKPSRYMPKAAARIFLRVMDVYPQQVQDITEADAEREGAVRAYPYYDLYTGKTEYMCSDKARFVGGFAALWDSINAKRGYGWEINPWVWVITFERCEKPEGWRT